MSRNRSKAAPKPPSIESPGNLPADVLEPAAAASLREKQRAREENEMFSSLRRELGSGGFVTLSRCHPGSGQFKQAHIGQMPIEDFSIERVAQIYGGGDYVAKGRTAGGTFLEAPRAFSIDHQIPPKNPNAGEKVAAAPAAPAIDVPAIVREVQQAARQETNAVVELAKSVMARGNEGAAPMMEMFKFLAEQQAKSAEQFRDMMAKSEERTAKILEKMAAREAAPAVEPRTLREQLEEAKELIDLIGGGGEKEGGDWKAELFKFAKEAVPVVVARLQIAGAGQPGGFPPNAMQPATVLPAPALASGAPSALPAAAPVSAPSAGAGVAQPGQVTDPAADPNSDMMIQIALNRFRVSAIAAAKKGKDPYEFICSTLDFVPEDYHGKIFETARSPDWFTLIFAGDAEAMRHMKFLTELREALFARALVAHAIRFKTVNKDLKETALQFAGWLPEDAKSAIWEWCEGENWQTLFDGCAVLEAPIDPAWLESLRLELDQLLGVEDPAPAAAAAVEIVSPAPGKAGGKPKGGGVRKTA